MIMLMDINTLVDNILLSHAAAEDNVYTKRSAAVNTAIDIIVPFLVTVALLATVFIAVARI